MNTSILIWTLLVIIGVSDARRHRIPNKLLVLLLALLCVSTLMQTQQQVLWVIFLDKSAAFGLAFAFGLVLHLLRVLAPGDVKLIAVLGFYLGTAGLVSYLYHVCLITALVGTMYWLLNRLSLATSAEVNIDNDTEEKVSHITLTGMVVSMQLNQQALKKRIVTGNDLTYMPFAPILVMGLALHQYYS